MDKIRILILSEENSLCSLVMEALQITQASDRRMDYELRNVPGGNIPEEFSSFHPLIAVIDLDREVFLDQLPSIKENFPETGLLGYSENPSKIPAKVKYCFQEIFNDETLLDRFSWTFRSLRDQLRLEALKDIIGNSSLIKNIAPIIVKARASKETVLIEGESGTGKELVAKAIASELKSVSVNCSAISENLFESELFGHVKGAFTGALSDKDGLFKAADGGVLFLDEVGEIPKSMQPKLLRALQTGEIRPVGSSQSQNVNVQIVAATNRDLRSEVERGNFREDLFYRLNIIYIHVPPLRERKEDIPHLIRHFFRKFAPKSETREQHALPVSDATMRSLVDYDWPGNIRELENATRRAVALRDSDELSLKNFIPDRDSTPAKRLRNWTGISTFSEFQELQKDEKREFLSAKIQENGFNIKKTAEALDIQRTAIYPIAKRLGLDIPNFEQR